VGAHDVVGGGNGGSNIGDGSWSSEIGGEPLSMRGTAALATVPAPGEVDDADDAPMAVGGGRGGGERQRQRRSSHRSGGATGDDGATAAAAMAVAPMATTTTPITERERMTHHWTMVGGRGSGGWDGYDVR